MVCDAGSQGPEWPPGLNPTHEQVPKRFYGALGAHVRPDITRAANSIHSFARVALFWLSARARPLGFARAILFYLRARA